jgi:hypothetical protein
VTALALHAGESELGVFGHEGVAAQTAHVLLCCSVEDVEGPGVGALLPDGELGGVAALAALGPDVVMGNDAGSVGWRRPGDDADDDGDDGGDD